METPPPIPQYAHPAPQRGNPDVEHLRILSICHWVGAGFAVLGLMFLAAHFLMMRTMFMNPAMWKNEPQGGPPEQFFTVMMVMYVFGALVMLLFLALNAMAARFLAMRKNRGFCLFVAGCNCIQVPLGTALGVFTFIVLTRQTVLDLYDAEARKTGAGT